MLLNLVTSETIQLKIFEAGTNIFFFKTKTFQDCIFSNIMRTRLSRNCNIGFFEAETFGESVKVVKTETF